MKQLTFLLFTFFSFSCLLSAQKTLPNVNVKTLDGKTVNLKEYAAQTGKTIIIDFWATWCSPCKKELDEIAELYPDWQKDYNVELLAITIDNQRALPKVPGIVETKGWEYTIFAGNEEEMRSAFNFQTIPQTLVADKNGNIVFEHNGYVPGDEVELEKVVAKAAGK
ncbi:MAG: TlpA family protein disulfide reductase [Lewinellaceae bacterium]|nr:TlpA family protein disulfide reductase [Saprospiraceae bacterium]MCB9339853.1 TlpA family protein disulfide reductase [Lewinellaceae bacterium]